METPNELAKLIGIGLVNKMNDKDLQDLKDRYYEAKKKMKQGRLEMEVIRVEALVKEMIPKDDLIDGEWYECTFEAYKYARYYKKAQWHEDRQEFLVPGQQQFGSDGWLDYFGDVIDKGIAGFIPMWIAKD